MRHWAEPFPAVAPADVVVEAFGCGLPAPYVDAMTARGEGAGVVHPRIPERGDLGRGHARARLAAPAAAAAATILVPRIHREDRRPRARARPARCARRFPARCRRASVAVVVAAGSARGPDEIRVSMFCYPNPALPALLDAWADGDENVVCLVPEGVAPGALDAWTGGNVPHPGHPFRRGRLSSTPSHSSRRTTTTGCCGCRPSISSAARTRSSARNGRRARSRGTSTRRPRARTGPSSTLSSIATPPASMRNRRRRCGGSGGPGTAAPGAPPIDAAWPDFAAARPRLQAHAEHGRRAWPRCRTWPPGWSRRPNVGYN